MLDLRKFKTVRLSVLTVKWVVFVFVVILVDELYFVALVSLAHLLLLLFN